MKVESSSVNIKVENVLAYLLSECAGEKITVSRVAKLAGVNRANLYQHHVDIIALIQSAGMHNRPLTVRAPKQQTKDQTAELQLLRKQVRSLALQCLELQLENDSLQSRLSMYLHKAERKKQSIPKRNPSEEGQKIG